MRPASFIRRLSPLALLALVLLAGCARSRGEDQADARSEPPAQTSANGRPGTGAPGQGEDENGQAMRLTPEGRARAAGENDDATDAAPDAGPSRALDARESVFAAERLSASPLAPSDIRIGSLRASGLARAERAAREAARQALLDVAVEGTIPEELLLDPGPGLRFEIEKLTGAAAGEATAGALPVRVGRPERLVTGENALAFRIVGDELSWTGELVLEMVEGQWYIADIQATTSPTAPETKYVPGVEDPARGW